MRKMTKSEDEKSKKMAEEYSKQYSEENVKKIKDKMGRYNKGPLQEIWDNVLALWDLLKDPNAGIAAKATAIGALLYMISPVDAIPDIIPGVGIIDDVAIITAAVASLAATLVKYKKKRDEEKESINEDNDK